MKTGIILVSLILGILTGCASNTLEITKCDKKVNGLCVKSHIIKFNKCNEPTKINDITYCKDK